MVEGLPEVVLGEGEHSFRVIFNPKVYRNCHELDVYVVDPSGRKMESKVERWGTKMRVFIVFGPDNPEGVCSVMLGGMCPDPVAKFWFVR